MNGQFGLSSGAIEKIYSVLRNYPAVQKVVIYGSRAKGNYREGSDIDLSLFGQNLTMGELGSIQDDLDELMLPYTFDLSVYQNLKNDQLREHIDRVGKVFY